MENLLEPWFKMNVGEGAFYALFGLVFVIAGIALLVLVLMLIGFIMKKVAAKKEKKTAVPASPSLPTAEIQDDGVSPETVAVITAALMSYYRKENAKCDFVVRRIKRL